MKKKTKKTIILASVIIGIIVLGYFIKEQASLTIVGGNYCAWVSDYSNKQVSLRINEFVPDFINTGEEYQWQIGSSSTYCGQDYIGAKPVIKGYTPACKTLAEGGYCSGNQGMSNLLVTYDAYGCKHYSFDIRGFTQFKSWEQGTCGDATNVPGWRYFITLTDGSNPQSEMCNLNPIYLGFQQVPCNYQIFGHVNDYGGSKGGVQPANTITQLECSNIGGSWRYVSELDSWVCEYSQINLNQKLQTINGGISVSGCGTIHPTRILWDGSNLIVPPGEWDASGWTCGNSNFGSNDYVNITINWDLSCNANTPADTNCDGIVDRSEITAYIIKWLNNQISRSELGQGIQAWGSS